MKKNNQNFPESLQNVKSAVQIANNVINWNDYLNTKDLFTLSISNQEYLKKLQAVSPDYGKPEFLSCVNGKGVLIDLPPEVINDFHKTVDCHPEFGLWFKKTTIQNKVTKKSTLLAARWLCHLVGFRHISVHLFIDHPTLDDYTFIQVRSLRKIESPGLFDLPAAGHVAGSYSIEKTLAQELREELNLELDDICNLEKIGSYESKEPINNSKMSNVEFRVVFRCRLKPESLAKLKFVDHEVAAISMFSNSELINLISNFPERVASGLGESFELYLKSKIKIDAIPA